LGEVQFSAHGACCDLPDHARRTGGRSQHFNDFSPDEGGVDVGHNHAWPMRDERAGEQGAVHTQRNGGPAQPGAYFVQVVGQWRRRRETSREQGGPQRGLGGVTEELCEGMTRMREQAVRQGPQGCE